VRQHLNTGDKRSVNKALIQALKLEAAKVAAGLTAGLIKGLQLLQEHSCQQLSIAGLNNLCVGSVGMANHLKRE
jgi:hypothetical protein